MNHEGFVACILCLPEGILIGKHSNGMYRNQFGVASCSAKADRRPQRVAARLAEVCTLGMIGSTKQAENQLVFRGTTALGLRVYTLHTLSNDLFTHIKSSVQYLQSCFVKTIHNTYECPQGLLPWDCIQLYASQELDPISTDALLFWSSIRKSVGVVSTQESERCEATEFETKV